MDKIDLKILRCIQNDASLSISAIASKVSLSTSPCWNRIQRLEASGVIRKRVALLDSRALNVGVTAFVSVRTSNHNANWAESFSEAVQQFPEVVEFYRMSGDVDYLLRVVVPDIAAYDDFYKRLIEEVDLQDVSSSFAMEELKFTTALPLDYVSHTDNLPD
ncbi:MAG: ArsR family transcriptional regulator [Rhodospirillaceae bacterium]|nr:ArsR family transcriptional regulator [Rhodospirillaceae bacterium]|tara:strand:- start:1385 stop:1867 length:483 start_codon:yes stop_codon:yes gene_type:complete